MWKCVFNIEPVCGKLRKIMKNSKTFKKIGKNKNKLYKLFNSIQ